MMVDTELAREPGAAFQARRLVEGFQCELDSNRRGDAVLAVSELVGNAYRHGEGRITLRVESVPSGLRAWVGDDGPAFRPLGPTGIGLSIVDAVSDDWGFNGDRTEVWFEIAA